MYVNRSARALTAGQKFGLYGYETLGDAHTGRLGTPIFNPFDGVTLGSAPTNPIEAAQKEVAEAGAAIAQASGKMAFDPAVGQKELIAAQARLAQATAKLETLLQQKKGSPKAVSNKGMPTEVIVALLALAGLGSYFLFFR